MKTTKRSHFSRAAWIVAAIAFRLAVHAQAQTETIIHNFTGTRGGAYPAGTLVFDQAGNIYGTTQNGGNLTECKGIGCGVVYQLSPTSTGGWTETVLHAFAGAGGGQVPLAGVTLDAAGNLYGVTKGGGAVNTKCFSGGCGVAFKLAPSTTGGWRETVLHTFTGGADGGNPEASLVLDAAGNLYGTTYLGGSGGQGTVFELSPSSGGGWTENVLYNFSANVYQGSNPQGPVVLDSAGNIYGSVPFSTDDGAVFELSPGSGGTWTEQTLFLFSGSGGSNPYGGVILDSSGNLYGTLEDGGTSQFYGQVFELSSTGNGSWTENALYNFTGGTDGGNPFGNMVFDAAGNLYGTTLFGKVGCGSAIKLSPSSGGWVETTLHSFTCKNDGAYPGPALTLDAAGNVYGVAQKGGSHGFGVVFKITP